MFFYDAPLLQLKARQHLECEVFRWQQAQGYNSIDCEIKREELTPQPGVIVAIRVTVSQYGSKALLDSQLFELRMATSNTSLMPSNEGLAA